MRVTKKLIRETKALVHLYLFLRDEIELKESPSLNGLKVLLNVLKTGKK